MECDQTKLRQTAGEVDDARSIQCEARIAELEAEGQSYQDRAERAEQWLHRVYSEIEDRFLKNGDRRSAVTGAPRRNA